MPFDRWAGAVELVLHIDSLRWEEAGEEEQEGWEVVGIIL